MHDEARAAVARMITASGTDPAGHWEALDLGGRNINGSIRDLFPNARWTGLDAAPGPGVDIVADATTWVPDRLFDLVVCTELLEHVQLWDHALITAYEALDPAGPGLLLLTCATTGRAPHGAAGAPHPAPGEWYENVPADRCAEVLHRLWREVHVDAHTTPGDLYAWARTPWEDHG